jgi:hypothetical protein
MLGIIFCLSLFSPTSSSAYAESRWSEIGELVKLKGGYPFAATKELFNKAVDIIIAKDEEALKRLLMTGLVGVTEEGDEAYYEGMEGGGWLPSGIVKIRFKGSTQTYYTNSEAVGIK